MAHQITTKWLKASVLAGAVLGLSGCMYGSAGGYYGDGYVNGYDQGCDPYAPFDDYYACDYGYGFSNIGYGGGWYDQYYYPGYGVYIFDRGGKRHAMRDNHRRHWAGQRAQYWARQSRRGHRANRANLSPEQRAERRERRAERRNYSGARQGETVRGERRGGSNMTGVARGSGQAARGNRNSADRSGRTSRRPTNAGQQAQARPQRADRRPAARPARVAQQPRPERPRASPRTSRSTQGRLNDE
ncbi:MAG: hypothetical protein ABJF89_07305 [Parasphingorhabdus sp.]|uniref:hypothetical protein n=3 Tax=Parasphingorhabdus sp. TaxID=2709688 RepID=UPI003266C3B2